MGHVFVRPEALGLRSDLMIFGKQGDAGAAKQNTRCAMEIKFILEVVTSLMMLDKQLSSALLLWHVGRALDELAESPQQVLVRTHLGNQF